MKECPYCLDRVNALKNHVRLSAGKGHGPSGQYPDDFDTKGLVRIEEPEEPDDSAGGLEPSDTADGVDETGEAEERDPSDGRPETEGSDDPAESETNNGGSSDVVAQSEYEAQQRAARDDSNGSDDPSPSDAEEVDADAESGHTDGSGDSMDDGPDDAPTGIGVPVNGVLMAVIVVGVAAIAYMLLVEPAGDGGETAVVDDDVADAEQEQPSTDSEPEPTTTGAGLIPEEKTTNGDAFDGLVEYDD